MSVAKVTEITSTSTKSFEDAIKSGISRATKTLKNVKGAWISEQKIEIENNKIKTYRVDMKVTSSPTNPDPAYRRGAGDGAVAAGAPPRRSRRASGHRVRPDREVW